MLTVEDIVFSYAAKPVIRGLSLSMAPGEIAAIIGPSGVGKTTLFSLLAGLLKPQQGTIHLASSCPPVYMMQEDLLLPWRTVLDNVLLVSELGDAPSRDPAIVERAHRLLEEVDLAGWKNAFPAQLSGGMRQRVALARSLLLDASLLLLDEPFGALDVTLREQMYDLLRGVHQRHRKTILLITHDFHDALALADHIFLLSNGVLTKKWTVPPEVRLDPKQKGEYQEMLRQALRTGG